MPSPFPGMDPYLEISGDWRDFHARFVTHCCEAIDEQLPGNYVARIDERFTVLELPTDRARSKYPDVSVVRTGPSSQSSEASAATATLEPVSVRIRMVLREEFRDTSIEIRRAPDWSLVTSVELLSPSNKVEPGLSDYISKRIALLKEPVHLVELDLLLGGQRLPMEDPLPPGDYHVLVSRFERRPDCEAYSWSIRRQLPVIPIPLSSPDPDIRLDLASVFASTYKRGRYERSINYGSPLNLPLAPEDRAWVEERAKTAIR